MTFYIKLKQFCLLLISTVMLIGCAGYDMADIYVDPAGSDNNSGTISQPFATIEKAQQAVRDSIKNGLAGDILVQLRGGKYQVEQTIKFDHRDFGQDSFKVHYQNYPEEQPVITSAKKIDNWKNEENSKIWSAQLDQPMVFRELYVDGKLATIARDYFFHAYPWEDPDNPDMKKHEVIRNIESYQGKFPVYRGYITTKKYDDMANWRNKSNIEFVFIRRWTIMSCPVEDIVPVNAGGVFISMQMPCFEDIQIKGGTHATEPDYVQNAFEVLDEPGEWYLDQTENKVYYIPLPGQDMTNIDVAVPTLETLVELNGTLDQPVKNIEFKGLNFQYTTFLRPGTAEGYSEIQATLTKDPDIDDNLHSNYKTTPAAVTLNAAHNIKFERCNFRQTAVAAINIENGSQNNVFRGCRFTEIGGNGIQIGGFNIPQAHPEDLRSIVQNNVINNCYFNGIGIIYHGGVAIIAGYTAGLEISHNEIANVGYSGISVGWGWGFWDKGSKPYPETSSQKVPDYYPVFDKHTINKDNVIVNNHIHHVMQELYDGAGIYTVSMNQNSLIKGNWVHDNPGYYDEKRDRAGHPGGIYLDEASGGFEVTENVVYNVSKPYNYNDMSYTGFAWQEREEMNNVYDNFFGGIPDCERLPRLCREYNKHKHNNFYGELPKRDHSSAQIMDNAGLESDYRNILDN